MTTRTGDALSHAAVLVSATSSFKRKICRQEFSAGFKPGSAAICRRGSRRQAQVSLEPIARVTPFAQYLLKPYRHRVQQ
jgi:hypothetical protein